MEQKFDKNYFEQVYKNEKGFLWGINPNPLTKRILKIKSKGDVLDLGCGEGKDALFLAKKGFKVDAIDISESAIKKLKERALKEKISINAKVEDFDNYKIKNNYDVILSLAAIHFIEDRKNLQKMIKNIQDKTRRGGINVITVFRKKDPSEGKFKMYFFEDKELLKYYSSWKVIYYSEYLKEDKHNEKDKVHFHRNAEIIAQKIE